MTVTQSCPTLCNTMVYTVGGILQARILGWVDGPFSGGSSQPRDRAQVSRIAGGFFTSWATREDHTTAYPCSKDWLVHLKGVKFRSIHVTANGIIWFFLWLGNIPVVMYGCENWTVKKAECQRIDAFELWCWRILLRVSWTARRSNQSILKISPGCSLEGTDVEAESPVLWPPHAKHWLIGKDPNSGKDWGQEKKGTTEDEMAG